MNLKFPFPHEDWGRKYLGSNLFILNTQFFKTLPDLICLQENRLHTGYIHILYRTKWFLSSRMCYKSKTEENSIIQITKNNVYYCIECFSFQNNVCIQLFFNYAFAVLFFLRPFLQYVGETCPFILYIIIPLRDSVSSFHH